MIVVVYVEPKEEIMRIVSARMATRSEERLFLKYFLGRGHD